MSEKRIFVCTGEPSGELAAVDLASAMRAREPELVFEGIGGERMRRAGFRLRHETRGWGSIGPLEALGRIPKLAATMLSTAQELRASPPALLVLVDFGAAHLRLARHLRRTGYRAPILYYFPPGAWFDEPRRARMVAAATTALSAFAHQRDFYAALGLPIAYFGHPLVSTVAPRPAHPRPPADGGRVAILPGSRRGELARHGRLLVEAARLLHVRRPRLEVVVGAADAEAELMMRGLCAEFPELPATVVRGARTALDEADAAWIVSGTAVLEAALLEVPAVTLYVVSRAQEGIARRLVARMRRPYVTLPNLILGQPLVPELLQERATQTALADALEAALADPDAQRAGCADLRRALGPPDALAQIADFALALAR